MPSGSSTSAGDARMLVASKRVVYVGGLADDVTQQVLRSAMIPFGNIKSLDIPMDYKIGKTRGFAFVEFDDPDDASECIFNMDMSDLCGRTIKVSLAQQNQLGKLSSSGSNSGKEGIWSSDAWFQEHVLNDNINDNGNSNIQTTNRTNEETKQDKVTLQD